MDRKDRHKKVRCLVCSRIMRSDILKRHASTHKDILSMSEDEAREELKARHEVNLEREKNVKTLKK